jgi:hypothetical protein
MLYHTHSSLSNIINKGKKSQYNIHSYMFNKISNFRKSLLHKSKQFLAIMTNVMNGVTCAPHFIGSSVFTPTSHEM